MKKTVLREYARLIVRCGLNVQKGQRLVISSPVECAYFARMCAAEAYEIGCKEVVMNWHDDAMARMKFPGKGIFMSTIIVTQMFSTVVLMVGIFKLMVLLGLNNSLVGIILLIAAFNQAFASWMLSGTFRSISFELEEAALIDGCNRMNAMLRVVLPLAAPGIVTAVIFVFINGWNEYTLTLILISDQLKKSLNTGIRSFFGYTNTEWHYVFAASMLATAPLLAFFQVLEKHLMGGLTAGGVKG